MYMRWLCHGVTAATSFSRRQPRLRSISKQKDTIKDRSRSTKPPRYRARGLFAGAGVALTYEGADAVFNVSSYRGALLLQAGARKADGGFAATKRGRGCIMHVAPHNYCVAGKLYDRVHTWRVLIFSLPLPRSLSPPSGLSNRDRDGKQPGEMDPLGAKDRQRKRTIFCPEKKRQIAESRCAAARMPR